MFIHLSFNLHVFTRPPQDVYDLTDVPRKKLLLVLYFLRVKVDIQKNYFSFAQCSLVNSHVTK